MENVRNYDISFWGEFVDKTVEREFSNYDMKYYSRFMGPVALIFGVIYMMFIISDYLDVENPFSFMVVLTIRVMFLAVSVALYFAVKKISNFSNLAYLITAYEIWAVISFLVIIYQYKSLGFISFLSVMVITLAVYITPNRLINAQMVSAFLNLTFFTLSYNNVDGIDTLMLLKIIAYSLILIIFSNIGACLTNYYKRKQFAESRELLRVSITDPLTGIYNRAKFGEELNMWVDYCNRYNTPLSLAIFDIDDFKRVNDNFGHLIGDSVIQNIADIIKMSIRRTDIFARWGGEEFVILLPNTGVDQAREMTERMRVCIQKYEYDKAENVTCSFGLVALDKNETAQSLLQRADKLLYNAKDWGKNTVACGADRIEEQIKTDIYTGFVS